MVSWLVTKTIQHSGQTRKYNKVITIKERAKVMSETVRYTGKLKLIPKLENESLEDQCKRILREHNYFELNEYYDSW